MKTVPAQPRHLIIGRCTRAFTLTEALVATAVFSLAILGLVYIQLIGLKYDQMVASKLGASETSRRGFDLLTMDIRTAKIWSVGNGNHSTYTPCGNDTNQLGNAIQLHQTTDTNSYIRYFFDTAQRRLCRAVSGKPHFTIIAENLTNVMDFRAEKYDGTLAQDLQYKYVIVTTMEFAQYHYPLTQVGPNHHYNYYRMQFKTASHCPN
ncbi:MAG TPA: hypothetical protein VEC99_11820 [Clostridia bacterium]|nr:hypothetical protein [Clostridia bacterium]